MSDTVITITGNIATEPEDRGKGATPITSFRLASTQRRFDKEANRWVDAHTNWFNVSAFRQLAVHALRSLHKGQRVIVTGKLKVRTWENASGKGTSVDIEADAIGPDLLWGTADFRKDDNGAGEQAAATEWEVKSLAEPAEDWAPSLASTPTPPPLPESAPVAALDREPAYAGQEAPF